MRLCQDGKEIKHNRKPGLYDHGCDFLLCASQLRKPCRHVPYIPGYATVALRGLYMSNMRHRQPQTTTSRLGGLLDTT